MKKRVIAATMLSLGLLLTGCGAQGGTTEKSSEADSNKPVKIVAVGSTALQPLVDAAKDQFIQEHPNYTVSVQGGGSGTGLSQVADGAVTIGNSDVFAEEKDGVDASKLVDHRVAVVGMGPVVNKEVGVKNLTKQQLIDVFTGKVKNWKEVGGKVQSQEQDSSGTVRKIVEQTPGAISYLAFSYMDDSTVALSIDGVEPKEEHVKDNSWKIWSYEHMYTKGEPNKEVKAFLDYMVTDDVQKTIVKDLGYLAITDMQVERDVNGKVTEK